MPTPSNLDFNEPEFPEYDPTPYGGGYDIVSTYGKPLPPSDRICHPRSVPAQPQASHGEDLVDHKAIKQNGHPNLPAVVDNARNLDAPVAADPPPAPELEFEYEYSPNGHTYPSEEKGYYDCGRQVPLPPNEYVEPCAGLFGYWPCLLKEYQRDNARRRCCEEAYVSDWRRTEEYFFGNPYSYCENNGVVRVDNYGYERHCVEQPICVVEKPYEYERHYGEQPDNVVEKSLALVDYNCGYEKDYVEQPGYAFEKSIVQVDYNYAYDKHYVEQSSHVYEQPISQVDFNYGYERQYDEEPSYVVEQPIAQLDYNYAYETQYIDQPSYVVEQPVAQLDYNYGYERNYGEQPSYDVEQPFTQVDYSYGYETQYVEQPTWVVEEPSYFEEEHSQQLWSQKLNNSYYESYQEP